ncbi:MAG: 16S rRNA (cytidine(1402)-2'-O)-methyltransferase [Acidobacteriota bacterium]|nr:16S rRNA (cytidine(1402)-2'-O)-methyltransferase [Acidobacteriota bacterium]MDH3528889.1 16S rRNA (cytidine(1402)-2'-O)-methyltransferase [Acidobacteriota bacterium]
MSGTLYLVSTPIGNMDDLSLRAVEILRTVDMVACEDTRRTGKLLKYFDLRKKLISFHEHNENRRREEIVSLILQGKSIALVSDAGTPCISDPGYGLVEAVRQTGAKVTVIPGPTAFVSALVLSGLPTDALYFGGFLPSKSGARKKLLREVAGIRATLIFFESARRLASSLSDCASVLGARRAAVVREITKLHEETITGDLLELAGRIKAEPPKGEIVLVIDRDTPVTSETVDDPESRLLELFDKLIATGSDRKTALKQAAKKCGYSKPVAYRIIQNR